MGRRGPGAGRLREIATAAEPMVDAPWDRDGMTAAERVICFLEHLPIVSGLRAGERLELLDFQRQFVRGVYGPTGPDGEMLVRQGNLSVGRGNGKSALMAGIGLAHLVGPMAEPYGQVLAAALDREQAGVLFEMTVAYIEASGWMAQRVNVKDWHKSILDEETRSTWRALTSDARKAHGLAPSLWICDEVAQWRSRTLWDNLKTGGAKRKHAIGITISTQAADDLHFWSEMLDAEPSPTIYTQLHAAPEGCALDDREAWSAANPALGEFLNETELADAAALAMRSPSFEPAFRLLNLNQRVDAEGRFLNAADWEANAETFDPVELEGRPCFGGLDLSSTKDLTAFALWFPEDGKLLAWHFVPTDTIGERVERDRVPYDRWAEAGWIEKTPGRATDRLSIAMRLADVRSRYDVCGIAFDRWRFEDLSKLLNDEGIELPLVEFVPGFKSYTPAVDTFERAVLERRMQHNGSPILKWQAGNVIIETDAAGGRKPSKRKSIDRIDGIVSAIMACGLAARQDKPGVSTDQWVAALLATSSFAEAR